MMSNCFHRRHCRTHLLGLDVAMQERYVDRLKRAPSRLVEQEEDERVSKISEAGHSEDARPDCCQTDQKRFAVVHLEAQESWHHNQEHAETVGDHHCEPHVTKALPIW